MNNFIAQAKSLCISNGLPMWSHKSPAFSCHTGSVLNSQLTFRTPIGYLRLPWVYITVRLPSSAHPASSPSLPFQKHFPINLCTSLSISISVTASWDRNEPNQLKSMLDHSPVLFLVRISSLCIEVLGLPCQSGNISLLLTELSSPILGTLPDTSRTLFVGADTQWFIIIFKKNML